jgi:mono/diheme cytochrome c family protein
MKKSFISQMQKKMSFRSFGAVSGFAALSLFAIATTASANDDIGKELFLKGSVPACAVCHTLKAAGAVGEVGPSMNELQPDVARVLSAIKNGIGIMPAYPNLSPEQMQILAEYVAKASTQ